MKIAVSGLGYVGLSNAVLLAQKNEVVATDISQERVNKVNLRLSPVRDEELEIYLREKKLNLRATCDPSEAYKNAQFVIIATPTNYDPETNHFDTSSVENVIKDIIDVNKEATIVVKSTIPVGFISRMRKELETDRLIFSPEFLREGKALYDNLHPSRIIVGDQSKAAKQFAALLLDGSLKKDVPILFTSQDEAEAIKLFANTYLAMRVSYFNELDSYAMCKNLDAKQIIDGVCLDPRISGSYNNPSFGYGGYCLPKDTKQLLANYGDIQQNLISAIVETNQTRKLLIATEIIKLRPKRVGIYRLIMKASSDNFRDSAVFDIVERLLESDVEVTIFEPLYREAKWNNLIVINDLNKFYSYNDVILANRRDAQTQVFNEKLFTLDLFGID